MWPRGHLNAFFFSERLLKHLHCEVMCHLRGFPQLCVGHSAGVAKAVNFSSCIYFGSHMISFFSCLKTFSLATLYTYFKYMYVCLCVLTLTLL